LEGEISEESKKSSRLKYVSTYQELFNFKEKVRTDGSVPNLANVKRTQRTLLQLNLRQQGYIYRVRFYYDIRDIGRYIRGTRGQLLYFNSDKDVQIVLGIIACCIHGKCSIHSS
jgi:hypothetical protein